MPSQHSWAVWTNPSLGPNNSEVSLWWHRAWHLWLGWGAGRSRGFALSGLQGSNGAESQQALRGDLGTV